MSANDHSATTIASFGPPASLGNDESRVEQALDWLSRNFERQPSLAEAAGRAGLSEHHFQRLFRRRWG